MSIENPLRIFTEEELSRLSSSNLKSFKKQKLLLFQLTSDTAVDFNGHSIDKNTLLSIFDELSSNLDKHLVLIDNTFLNEILKSNNLKIFENSSQFDIQNIDDDLKSEIFTRIANKVNITLPGLIRDRLISFKSVKHITDFFVMHAPHMIDDAFHDTYDLMASFTADLENEYEHPYAKSTGTEFDRGIHVGVDIVFFGYFHSLPPIFEPIKRDYGIWCNNNVVVEAFQRERSFSKFSRKTLYTLKDALDIAAQVHNNENNKQNSKAIAAHLGNKSARRNDGEGSGRTVLWFIFVTLFFFFKLATIAKSCNQNDSYSYSEVDIYNRSKNKIYDQERIQNILNKKNLRKDDSKRSQRDLFALEELNIFIDNYYNPTDSRKIVTGINGSQLIFLNDEFINSKVIDSTIYLYYEVDIFPTETIFFKDLIPDWFKVEFKDKNVPVVMDFRLRSDENSRMRHTMDIHCEADNVDCTVDNKYVLKKTKSQKKLNIKKLKVSDFDFKGVISRYDYNIRKWDDTKIAIKYDVEDKIYEAEYNGRQFQFNEKLGYPDTKNQVLKYEDMMAIILQNLKIVQLKYPTDGSLYKIENLASYHRITPNDDELTAIGDWEVNAANMKLYTTTLPDRISYINVSSKDVVANYMIDKEGYLQCMQLTMVNKNHKTLERIVLYRSN